MKFERVGKHTIKCVISEEEIGELGFTLEEIMSNGERTQEFMNQIFDLAEQEFEMKFDFGINTVRADFQPNHTLTLTFSEHPAAEGMMEHLKDIINGLIGSIPQDKIEDIKKQSQDKKQDEDEVIVYVMLVFEDFDLVQRFAKTVRIDNLPPSKLFKFENEYYLFLDLTDAEEKDVMRLSVLTDEYAQDIVVGAERRAFLEEHAKVILPEHAIQTLALL